MTIISAGIRHRSIMRITPYPIGGSPVNALQRSNLFCGPEAARSQKIIPIDMEKIIRWIPIPRQRAGGKIGVWIC
jgi:hypothetical protein